MMTPRALLLWAVKLKRPQLRLSQVLTVLTGDITLLSHTPKQGTRCSSATPFNTGILNSLDNRLVLTSGILTKPDQ